MNEFERIALIQKKISTSKRVIIGIGDDTAVVRAPKGRALLTVDCLVEDVHFRFSYASPRDIGHKALAVNLSDIAAMGGKPLYAVVSMGCTPKQGPEFLSEFYDGMGALAKKEDVDIVGGNLTGSSKFFVDVTVVGEARGRSLLRSGAQPGDLLAVTGFLGASAAGLRCLNKRVQSSAGVRILCESHLRPHPRVREGLALQKISGVHAAIDISDGLASELHHLSEASKVGTEIRSDFVPIAPAVRRLCADWKVDALEMALFGGEDYELLLSLAPKSLKTAQRALRRLGGNLIVIGKVSKKRHVTIRRGNGPAEPLAAKGWHHWG